jgi:hypothetical protein
MCQQLRQRLRALVPTLSQDQQIELLYTLDRPTLEIFALEFGIVECECELRQVRETSTGIRYTPPCECWASEWEPRVSFEVLHLLERLLDPDAYREPIGAPVHPTACMTTETKSVVLAQRAAAGLGLWHQGDALQKDFNPDNIKRIGNVRLMNGQKRAGVVVPAVGVAA